MHTADIHYFHHDTVSQQCHNIIADCFMTLIQVNLRQLAPPAKKHGGFYWSSFPACMPLLTVTITLRLDRRR